MATVLHDWQRSLGSWNPGLFIGPLPQWHYVEAEDTWRRTLVSDYHEGRPLNHDLDADYKAEDVMEELWDLMEYFAMPLTNNGDGRTYHYVHVADFMHEIIEAFKRQGWQPPADNA